MAIDNLPIRRRVLERDPPPNTLDTALSASVRLEALDASEAAQRPTTTLDEQTANTRIKPVRRVLADNDRIQQLEKEMESMRRQLKDTTTRAEQWRQQAYVPTHTAAAAEWQIQSGSRSSTCAIQCHA